MFETIGAIVQVLDKLLPTLDFGKWKREQRLKELGTELFRIYVHLNEILVNGRDIQRSIRTYIGRMEQHLSTENDEYALTGGQWIAHRIREQQHSIAQLGRALQRVGTQFQVVDGSTYARLMPLISGKLNVLDSLLAVLSAERVPLFAVAEEELLQLRSLPNRPDINTLKALRDRMLSESVSTSEPWDENVYLKLRSYLDSGAADERLDAIEQLLEKLKAALEQHFSLADVLLGIGDERFGEAYNGEYFW
jgi:hypothetical protein